jgi:hypothetical protein
MRMSASWFGSWTHRIQGRGAIDPRPESGLPSDRHTDRTKRTVVLEAVKVWPGKGGVRRKVGATANLDSSCAWFYVRTKSAPQTRKTMIVALARKLLIALWRLVREGLIPEGIVLRPAL